MHLTSFTAALAALAFSFTFTPAASQPTIFRRSNSSSVLPPTTRYSEQTWIGTHHSAMLRTLQNGFSLSGNQFHNITVQLEAGVRVLYGQIFYIAGDIRVCHSSCALLDGGRLQDILSEVGAFMKRYEGEVVTLLWTNPDGNTPLAVLDRVYKLIGMDAISYIPPHAAMNITDWPTIEEMVLASRRLVTFMDAAANPSMVPYILPQGAYIAATPATTTDPAAFACGTGSSLTLPGEKLGLLNHLLYDPVFRSGQSFPDVAKASTTNAAPGSLLDHLDTCLAAWGRKPNFALVDFFDRGDVFTAQDIVNGILPHPPTSSSPSTSTSPQQQDLIAPPPRQPQPAPAHS